MKCDVVIAGAGPVGLMLAAELRLAGVSVVVLERLTEVNNSIKAGGINGRSTQLLARRGLREKLEAASAEHGDGFTAFAKESAAVADRSTNRFAGHFAGLFLHPSPEFDLPRSTVLPQQALEELLGRWLGELDVPVLRNHAVTSFMQDRDAVRVRAMSGVGEVLFECSYLVGCDGGRSTVRKLAGFEFPGTDPLTTGYQAIVTLDRPECLPLGWNLTDTGLCAHGPKPGRLLLVGFDGPPSNRDAELKIDELQDSLQRISGTDVSITEIHAWTRFTDNTRQASTYRTGRVLLAGDAAHIHPPLGGQGLNLGLQDAVNLGWKLAATAQGWAPDGLLDTYVSERHPVAEAVLTNTRAQIAILRPDPHSRAMRNVFAELLEKTPLMGERLVGMLQGLDIRYEPGQASHPLVGRHAPDLVGLEDAMRSPRPILFDMLGHAELQAAAAAWTDRIDVRSLSVPTGLGAMLLRPDGYVAWAVEGTSRASDLVKLQAALAKWFGDAQVSGATRRKPEEVSSRREGRKRTAGQSAM